MSGAWEEIFEEGVIVEKTYSLFFKTVFRSLKEFIEWEFFAWNNRRNNKYHLSVLFPNFF